MFQRFLIIFFLLWPFLAHASPVPGKGAYDYDLRVSFDVARSKIMGEAKIRVHSAKELTLQMGELKISEAKLNGAFIDLAKPGDGLPLRIPIDGILEIKYEGDFRGTGIFPDSQDAGFSSVIDERGIWLSGIWYPKPEGLGHYRLSAILPLGFEAISEGDKIEKRNKNGQTTFFFHFPHPVDALHFIASNRYALSRDRLNQIDVFAYFFPENRDLAPTYLAKAKEYLRRYEETLGPFPYRRFAIVENFLPTGYSLPTFTLLGSEVIKLPFIVDTSLGHEILHQWLGNSVYVDDTQGNWAEGLTTYLADHLYEEEIGKGWEYRKNALIGYQSYVNDRNEQPLRDFQWRSDKSSEAIGYGKSLMVFHMLNKMMGKEAFRDSLRVFVTEKRFQRVSWRDLKEVWGRNFPEDLTPFFRQWVDEKGMPEIGLDGEIKIRPLGRQFEVVLSLTQKQKTYSFLLPISFYSPAGKTRRIFPIHQEKTRLQVLLDDFPQKIILDEDYDLARKLTPKEFPPVIARLLGDEHLLVLRPRTAPERYAKAVDFFERKGLKIMEEGQPFQEEMKESSVIIFGSEDPLVEKWFGAIPKETGLTLTVRENPWNDARVVGIIQARSREELESAFPKIRHYGKFSQLVFERGANKSKKVARSERGIMKEVFQEAAAVEISALESLPEVLDKVADKRIVYVGESHDRFAHHLMQLEMIKGLHQKGKKVAIGMEMFQRPFQKGIDDYIAERIDEREFLKITEYFQRWRFDYNHYRPILQFARKAKIPVIALNAPREITDKISQNGLDALSEEEKRGLSGQLDFSDEAYRERLNKIFEEHKEFGSKNFDNFYQVQVVWDETMAETIDSFLKGNPDTQMVVLAGGGHLSFGSGIPQRAFRRNGYPYAVILNEGPVEKGAATFVLFPGTAPFEGSPKLMVFLRDENGRVIIESFPEGSVSEKAGLRKGDVILSLDETPVQSFEDVRLEMIFKKKGAPVQVKVQRTGSSGEETKIVYSVIPQ